MFCHPAAESLCHSQPLYHILLARSREHIDSTHVVSGLSGISSFGCAVRFSAHFLRRRVPLSRILRLSLAFDSGTADFLETLVWWAWVLKTAESATSAGGAAAAQAAHWTLVGSAPWVARWLVAMAWAWLDGRGAAQGQEGPRHWEEAGPASRGPSGTVPLSIDAGAP